MVFSKNLTSWHSKHLLAWSMGLKIEGSKGKYLGLPMLIGKSKKGTFQEVVERVEKKYQSWKVKILSQAARTFLIHTVTSTMPLYVMSSLKLLKETAKKLVALNMKFWWGSKENDSNCCILKNWDSICKPKFMGGLGLRKSEDFNQALLTKLAWEVQKNEDKLWVKIFRRKYLKVGSFTNIRPPKQVSWICKSLFSCNKLIKKGMCYKVGDGRSINIWDDPWVPKELDFR